MSHNGLYNKGTTRRHIRAALCLLLVAVGLSPVVRAAADNALVLGVFPRKGFTRTLESFTPLAEYLSRQLQRKVVVKSGRNFNDFWQGVVQRDYDLVHYNQYHYVRSHQEAGYDVIARNEENHRSTMSGALIVRKDSGINSLSDLRGKKVVFGGGRHAMQSYIVPAYLLQQAGLPATAYETAFAESPTNAIYVAYFRQAMAAGSADVNLELPVVKQRIDTRQLRILARGEKLAHLPWAVKRELPAELKATIGHVLTTISESEAGREVLKRADLTGIKTTSNAEYDAHREIILKVLGEEY